MNNTWAVDPDDKWLEANKQWLREANLPNVERCQETLTNVRCELIAGHESNHMIHMEQREPVQV